MGKIYIKEVQTYLFVYKKEGISNIKQLINNWKQSNIIQKKLCDRAINLPLSISEGLVCLYLKNCGRVCSFTKSNKKIRGCYDCYDFKRNIGIQVKSSSSQNDLTSFGHKTKFDELYYVYIDIESDKYDIYKIPTEVIKNIKVNKTETFESQALQKRRPRFSIYKKILKSCPEIFRVHTGKISNL